MLRRNFNFSYNSIYPACKTRNLLVYHLSYRKSSYYSRLGVSSTATTKEIQQAFQKKSKECHPDLFPNDKRKEEEFKKVGQAYDILKNKTTRENYDREVKIGNQVKGYNMNYSYKQPGQQGYYSPRSSKNFRYHDPNAYRTWKTDTYTNEWTEKENERKFKKAQQSQHERTEAWHKVYEEINKDRHSKYEQAKKNAEPDYSNFYSGRKGGHKKNYRKFYEQPNDFQEGGDKSTWADENNEGRRFNSRMEEDILRERQKFGKHRYTDMQRYTFYACIFGISYLFARMALFIAMKQRSNTANDTVVEYMKEIQNDNQDKSMISAATVIRLEEDLEYKRKLREREKLIERENELVMRSLSDRDRTDLLSKNAHHHHAKW